MNDTKKQSPLDKLKSLSKTNLDQHLASDPIFSLTSSDGESQPIATELIDPNPWQPRRDFNPLKIEQLAESIDVHGLIEPIVVRKHENRFQIIAGERRWRAHQLLKKPHISAIVKCADDMQMRLIAVAENLDREDLSDYEVALAIHGVQEKFGSRTELARYLKKTRSELYRYLAFMDLPEWLRSKLDEKPFLLNRTAAEELKRLFAKESIDHQNYRQATLKAIEFIEAGELTQIRVASEIEKIAALASSDQKPNLSPVSQSKSEPTLFVNEKGKAVGKLKNNGKKITLTLSCAAFSVEQEKSLQEFVSELLKR
ncbi:ParB/RepB/Spo0J family partition protein [Methylomicrobium sp. Wu6]|uniref:ParB/RepB/Spo0J family partition protein n=1 Tax=Methylomicrobium sp. Wu6 TaxID=3107928 RepID=UPI002DD6AA4C|nr:ParB/RepB/Spo0J family partition protein [Methylomicrobium sp. Wu6]MEC4749860.1 ParB/RepB/Spo0J family partition protein [Methylomicrobium sp. Wu6]